MLGSYGVFRCHSQLTPQLAADFEAMGYGTLWIGSSPPADLGVVEQMLAATSTMRVATGIVNIWKDPAEPVAASYHRLEARYPGRFLLGIGVGHPEQSSVYTKPYDAVVAYLDELDQLGVPAERRILAALRDRMLRLAKYRSLGAHPYLVTPAHTAHARSVLGAGVVLAPEQRVVLESDLVAARAIVRPTIQQPYLGLSNYRANLRALGYDDTDFDNGGSDRLVDALTVSGDAGSAAAGLAAHLIAGADHVAVNLIGGEEDSDAVRAGYAALATELFVSSA